MLFQQSVVSVVLSCVTGVQVAVDSSGAIMSRHEDPHPKGKGGVAKGPIGEVKARRPKLFEGYKQIAGSCIAGDGKTALLQRPMKRGMKAVKACKEECDETEDCAGFEVHGEDDCKLYSEVNVVESEKKGGRCKLESCCFVAKVQIDCEAGETKCQVSSPKGTKGDDGADCPDGAKMENLLEVEGMHLATTTGFTNLSRAEADEFLAEHNKYRCMHGAGALTWNANMAKNAADWGQTCCQSGLSHSNSYSMSPQSGENLAAGYGSIAAAVKGWYDEVDDCGPFPGCDAGKSGVVGHFTAMVWTSSHELGCSVNPTGWSNRPLYVCHYASSAPNFVGSYTSNVEAKSKTEAQCASGSGGSDGGSDDTGSGGSDGGSGGSDTFMIHGANKNECPSGYARITTEAECRDAATAKSRTFQKVFSNAGKPTGCYEQIGGTHSGKFKLNTAHPGAASSSGAPVCKTSQSDDDDDTSPPDSDSDSGCTDARPTTISLGGNPATCDQLLPYCAGYSFVRDQCPCICDVQPTPAPPAAEAGSLGTCCNCASSEECADHANGGFCCPYMKKCIPNSQQSCYTSPDCNPAR